MKTEKGFLRIGVLTMVLLAAALAFHSWGGEAWSPQVSEWKAPEEAKEESNPVSADEESLKKGKALYGEYCAMCHGAEGAGDGMMAPHLDPPPGLLSRETLGEESDGELFWKLSKGKDAMPDFESMISKEEIWHIVNFLRGL